MILLEIIMAELAGFLRGHYTVYDTSNTIFCNINLSAVSIKLNDDHIRISSVSCTTNIKLSDLQINDIKHTIIRHVILYEVYCNIQNVFYTPCNNCQDEFVRAWEKLLKRLGYKQTASSTSHEIIRRFIKKIDVNNKISILLLTGDLLDGVEIEIDKICILTNIISNRMMEYYKHAA